MGNEGAELGVSLIPGRDVSRSQTCTAGRAARRPRPLGIRSAGRRRSARFADRPCDRCHGRSCAARCVGCRCTHGAGRRDRCRTPSSSGRMGSRLAGRVGRCAVRRRTPRGLRSDPGEVARRDRRGRIAMAVPVLILHVVSPDSMGFGDVKAALVLGAAVGTIDWRLGAVALCLAALSGAVAGVLGRRRTIAFGPCLVFGAWTVVSQANRSSSHSSPGLLHDDEGNRDDGGGGLRRFRSPISDRRSSASGPGFDPTSRRRSRIAAGVALAAVAIGGNLLVYSNLDASKPVVQAVRDVPAGEQITERHVPHRRRRRRFDGQRDRRRPSRIAGRHLREGAPRRRLARHGRVAPSGPVGDPWQFGGGDPGRRRCTSDGAARAICDRAGRSGRTVGGRRQHHLGARPGGGLADARHRQRSDCNRSRSRSQRAMLHRSLRPTTCESYSSTQPRIPQWLVMPRPAEGEP